MSSSQSPNQSMFNVSATTAPSEGSLSRRRTREELLECGGCGHKLGLPAYMVRECESDAFCPACFDTLKRRGCTPRPLSDKFVNALHLAQHQDSTVVENDTSIRRAIVSLLRDGTQRLRVDNLKDALRCYNTALSKFEESCMFTQQRLLRMSRHEVMELYVERGTALYKCGRFDQALADFREGVALDPGLRPRIWGRAQLVCTAMCDFEGAILFCDKIAAANGGRMSDEQARERDRLVQGAERAKELQATVIDEESLSDLLAMFPVAQPVRIALCELYIKASNFDKAIATLTAAPLRTPQIALLLAKTLYMTGFEEFPRAKSTIAEFAAVDAECRAMQKTIQKVDEHKQKGNDLFSAKHFADSIGCYTNAIELASTNGRVLRVLYCNRAAAFKEVGRFREGVEDCTKAISFDPNFCKAFARRARCMMGCQDYQSAVQDFKKACEMAPTDMDLSRELRHAERLAAGEAAKEKDLYHVLGVAKTATQQEIKARWRTLSIQYHPDKCMQLPDVQRAERLHKFKVISEAYHTLSNSDTRAKYDAASATGVLVSGCRTTTQRCLWMKHKEHQ